jgi:hypothetical protein
MTAIIGLDHALGSILMGCVFALVAIYSTNPILYTTQVEFDAPIRNSTCHKIPAFPTIEEASTFVPHMQLVCNGYRSEIKTLYSSTVWFTTASLFYMACNFAANHNKRARSSTFWSAGMLTTIVHVFTIQYMDTSATVWGNVLSASSTTHVYHTHIGIATYALVGTMIAVCLLGVIWSLHQESAESKRPLFSGLVLPRKKVIRNAGSVQFVFFTVGWIGLFLCCVTIHFFDAVRVRMDAPWMKMQPLPLRFHVLQLLPPSSDPYEWDITNSTELPTWLIAVTFSAFLFVKLTNLAVPLSKSLFVFAFSVACTWQAVQTWLFSAVPSTLSQYGYSVNFEFSLRTLAFLTFGAIIMISMAAEDELSFWPATELEDSVVEVQKEKTTEGEDFALLFKPW